MRIECPYCGFRDVREFSYLGDAEAARGGAALDESDARAAAERVYLRANPAGRHVGLWQHEAGCRSWLAIERDTRTHAIFAVALADAGAGR